MKKIFKYLFVIVFLIVFAKKSNTQSLAFDLLDGKDKITLPFNYVQGFIILDLKFHNTLPLHFIFDTGAENTILFHKQFAILLNLPFTKVVKVQGPDLKKSIDAYICRHVFIEVDKLANVERDIIVLDEDILRLDKLTGIEISGLIGTSFFKGLILHIDYKRNKLILYDSRNFNEKILKKFKEVPVVLNQSKAYVNCDIQISPQLIQNVNLLVDTGAGISILLYDKQEHIEGGIVIPTGNMGHVVSGSLMGYLGRLHSLKFGEFEFNNLISNLIQNDDLLQIDGKIEKQGIIGNAILSRFDIIFDYLHNRLYLKPHKQYNKNFEYDKSGMEIYATGSEHKDYFVNMVVKNSPSYFARIKKGDIIKSINGKSNKLMDITTLNDIFTKKEGTFISLEILRDGMIINKSFQLFDYLKPVEENLHYIWEPVKKMEVY